MGEPLLKKLYIAGVRDLIVRPASGGDYVTATKGLRVRLPDGRQAGAIAQTDINGPTLSMLITQDGTGLVWCETAAKTVNSRTPELVRSRPREVPTEEVTNELFVLWYRGGDGPDGPVCTPPDPEDPTFEGIVFAFETVTTFTTTNCGSFSSLEAYLLPRTDPNIEPEIVNRSGPCNTGFLFFDADSGEVGPRVYVSVDYSGQLIEDPDFFESSGYYYQYSGGQFNDNCSTPSDEEWAEEQPWQKIEYAFPITASHSGSTLTVRDSDDEIVQEISISVVQFEITNDPDNNPDND